MTDTENLLHCKNLIPSFHESIRNFLQIQGTYRYPNDKVKKDSSIPSYSEEVWDLFGNESLNTTLQ